MIGRLHHPFHRFVIGFAVFLTLAPASARAQTACEIYAVQPGDTLGEIARRANVEGGFQALFSANRDVLDDPATLEVGVRIRMPCADGTLPQGVIAPRVVQPQPVAAVTGPLPEIRFLTGGRYPPFVDENLPQAGLITEIVGAAIEAGASDQPYRIDHVTDWNVHLDVLLPSGAFDLGFPWHMPDCNRLELLSPSNAARCTDFNASAPLFEAVVGYYTLSESRFAGAMSHDQLIGARLCRPRGWFTFDLEAEGLVAPAVTLVEARNRNVCWRALAEGNADIVTFDALPAEADIRRLGLTGDVVEISPLSQLATMHVFAPKSHPNGQAFLDIIDAGLAETRRNGLWFAIVARHLTHYNAEAGDGT